MTERWLTSVCCPLVPVWSGASSGRDRIRKFRGSCSRREGLLFTFTGGETCLLGGSARHILLVSHNSAVATFPAEQLSLLKHENNFMRLETFFPFLTATITVRCTVAVDTSAAALR